MSTRASAKVTLSSTANGAKTTATANGSSIGNSNGAMSTPRSRTRATVISTKAVIATADAADDLVDLLSPLIDEVDEAPIKVLPSLPLTAEERRQKLATAWTRIWTSFVMFFFIFVPVLYIGHSALLCLLFFVQVNMYKEIKRLTHLLSRRTALPSFRPLQWYWFFIAIFFTYGKLLDNYFHYRPVPYLTFISFILYALGVVAFVLTLQKGYYKYQFEMFAWVHLTLLMVVVQSTFIAVNIFQGIIWFLLPAMLIIFNDSWAWVFGMLFGRTPLIALSPKKTVEGFLGGLLMTLLCGFFLPIALSSYQYITCPQYDLSVYAAYPTCAAVYPFVAVQYDWSEYLPVSLLTTISHTLSLDSSNIISSSISSNNSSHLLTLIPLQLHGLAFAAFASLIGPFGGFFASGFKRAFNIKDFGVIIPGHGGVTDRMDCQIIMGLFVFVYYFSFVSDGVNGITGSSNNSNSVISSSSVNDAATAVAAAAATVVPSIFQQFNLLSADQQQGLVTIMQQMLKNNTITA